MSTARAPGDAARSGVAAAGRLAATIERRVGGRRHAWYVVTGLVLMSLIPVLFIGSSPRPTDLTFEDVRLERIPAMTSWVRLEGDLRVREGGIGNLYELHDLKDDDLYVLIHNAASLATGRQLVTGRISPRAADDRQHRHADRRRAGGAEGQRAVRGHPLPGGRRRVRGDGDQRRLSGQAARTRLQGGAASARTGCGRGGSLERPDRGRDRAARRVDRRPASRVEGEPDRFDVTIASDDATHVVRTRRPAAADRVRLCRTDGCEPGLEIHAPTADLLLLFDDGAVRDRLAATLR